MPINNWFLSVKRSETYGTLLGTEAGQRPLTLNTEKVLSVSDLPSKETAEGQVDKGSFDIAEEGEIVAFLELATEILPLQSLCLLPRSILS